MGRETVSFPGGQDGDAVSREFAALGLDDMVYVMSALDSLVRDPGVFRHWSDVVWEPMPSVGPHCIRVAFGSDEGGGFEGWSAVCAIQDEGMVVLRVRRGVEVADLDVAVAQARYAAVERAIVEDGGRIVPWPGHGDAYSRGGGR